jgi:ADP-ribose pyrophosphatase YjhB (NUDIX family)
MNTVYGCICVSPNAEVLLVRNRVGHKWSFPKGHMENSDATTLDCARRELMEEAGINAPLKSDGLIHLRAASYYVFQCNNCQPININDKNEIDQVKWFHIKDLPDSCNVDVSMFKRLIGMYKNINNTSGEKTALYISSEYAARKFMEMNKRLENKAQQTQTQEM